MFVDDSSESSADEEDRRLKPLRSNNNSLLGRQIAIIDSSDKPEGCTFKRIVHDKENKTSKLDNDIKCSFEAVISGIVSHSLCLEGFLLTIKEMPAQLECSQNMMFGLKNIKQSFTRSSALNDNKSHNSNSVIHEENFDNDCRSRSDTNCNNIEESITQVLTKNLCDASSQTDIIGEVVPQETSRILEYFQSLLVGREFQ